MEDEAFRGPERVLSEELLLTLGLDILNGLIHLHGQGIIHNDIKPQNIFLRERGQGAVLGDFGQSKRHLASDKMLKLPRPQKEYAAPEQQETGRGSFPVDVWALGITLYEVVIGVRPDLDREFQLLPGKKFLDQSKGLQEVIAVMLTPDPKARLSAETLTTYAFFKSSEQQLPQDQGQELKVNQEAQDGQEDLGYQESALKHPRDEVEVKETEGKETEGDTNEDESACKRPRFKPKDDDIEYFSEPSDYGDEGETSDEHREVPLDDIPEPSASLHREDEHDREEEHDYKEEGASEDSTDDEDDDGETGSDSNSGTTVDSTSGAHKLFFGQYSGIEKVMIDYDKKRAAGQSGEVAVEVVLEEGEGKKEADAEDAYNTESDGSEEDEEWVEVP